MRRSMSDCVKAMLCYRFSLKEVRLFIDISMRNNENKGCLGRSVMARLYDNVI
jgi:hypothetical protein